ncbi:hypothetical protein EBH_0010190 [Eimeria brunetti]|uniref:Uncharacterized protein n=1 Tax=Eimeria brunetti TaxID=51314 RepID=U6LDU0_9EIME|nr:hypothetical protein EBH_0010190 [Eimeria brunetti]
MPLETFLRLIGFGYALPLLDAHLSKEAASLQQLQQLPPLLFRLLEGVEGYWQQLQQQVSLWVQEERQLTWAMGTGPQPSHFFCPHSDESEDQQQQQQQQQQLQQLQQQQQQQGGPAVSADAAAPTRWRVPLPDNFLVREAFNSKNWKGQVAFTAAARAALDAFAAETLHRLRDAGGDQLEALVLNASSPQILNLSAQIGYPPDSPSAHLQQQQEQQQQQQQQQQQARERFTGRLLVRGAVRALEAPASSFLLKATREEEAVLSSMGRGEY